MGYHTLLLLVQVVLTGLGAFIVERMIRVWLGSLATI